MGGKLVFCGKCGTPIGIEDCFCKKCGTKANDSSAVVLENEKTLANIKRFRSKMECKCLECGYKGLMGVVRNKTNPFLAIAISTVLSVAVYFIIAYIIDYIFVSIDAKNFEITGFIVVIMSLTATFTVFGSLIGLMSAKKILFCPNCEKEIQF